MAGLPKKYAKMGFKKGWKAYKASKKGTKTKAKSKKSRSRPKAKGGNRRMGKKGGFNTQKIFKLVRIGALALPAVARMTDNRVSMEGRVRNALKAYTGYDIANKSFRLQDAAEGWMPFVAASLITYGVPKITGMIRGL